MQFEIKDVQTMQTALAEFCRFLDESRVSPQSIFDSRLVATELVGNVLRHAGGMAWFMGEIKDGFVELRVRAERPFIPPKTSQCSTVYSEHGRGLYLVDSVSAERITDENGVTVVKIVIR